MGEQRLKVVVLDSEPIVLATIATYLADSGHHVRVGPSSPEQLQCIDDCLGDADVVMVETLPFEKNRSAVIDHIRESFPTVALVLMQQNGFHFDIDDTTARSPMTILRKPIRLSELENILSRIQDRKTQHLAKPKNKSSEFKNANIATRGEL